MNSEIEKSIVKAFVVENKAERLLYELSSRKKRRECIWGMNTSLFKPNCCEKIDSKSFSPQSAAEYLARFSAAEHCYVLSIDEQLDGKLLKTEEAINELIGSGPFLLSFDHGRSAYFEGETEKGAPERCLLIRK